MPALTGQLNHVAANTEFEAMANDIFNRKTDSVWTQLAKVVPCPGQYLELDAIGPSPAVAKMLGSRPFSSLRAYAKPTPVVEYSADGLELPRIVVEGDKSGIVRSRLADYLASVADFFEKPVIDLLLSNPVGIDGVSLLNDSHPYGAASGTWDNKTTDALTQTSLEAGIVAMRGLRFENGEPAGFFPTHLVVGPALEREALDLTGADRMIPVSNAGAPDAAASVVAAVTLRNWVGGRLQVFVVDRFANGTNDNDWYLMDLSKPNVRPLAVGQQLAPSGVVVDSPTSDAMVQRAAYQYYVSATAAITGYAPQCIYGKNA
jgi:phage major head subunit gpT-like protein